MGEKKVPRQRYWGIHTERARENFFLSGRLVCPRLIRSLALVKKACALANRELGYLSDEKAGAIIAACEEVAEGKLAGEFPVDALQGGAGTSTNMNVNEVLANRAIELLGGEKGQYDKVHPLEDVNRHQSTNDVYPTALKIAFICGLRELSQAIASLQGAFQRKEKEFAGIVKIGRTELQEAVPMTLGAEFSAFAEAFGRDRWRAFKNEERLRVVNIGGTSVGTGLAAPRRYIFLVIEKLRETTGLGLARAENLLDQTANADVFVETSGILKAHAMSLIKVAGDLRLLNLLGEIRLSALQAGSSAMPGKINPVIPEAVIQAGLKVLGNDLIVAEAVSRASLQINEFMPLLADAVLESVDLLRLSDEMLAGAVGLLAADPAACRAYFNRSLTLITAFIPHIGYEKATALLEDFRASGKTDLKDFLAQRLGAPLVDRVLSAQDLTRLGYDDGSENP